MCSRTIPLNMGGDKDLSILREFIKHPSKKTLSARRTVVAQDNGPNRAVPCILRDSFRGPQ